MTEKEAVSRGGKVIFVVLLVLLILMTLYFASARRSILGTDGLHYIRAAESVMESPLSLLRLQTRRAPLYPAILAAGFSLFGKSLLMFHVFPFFFMLASPLLFLLLIRRITGSGWWALLASFILLLFPNSRDMMSRPLTESLSVFLMILAMLLVELCGSKKKYFLFLLLCLPCLFLTRYELILAVAIFGGCGAFRFMRAGDRRKTWLILLPAFILFAILMMVIFLVILGKGLLPENIQWYREVFLKNIEKPVSQIYMHQTFTTLFRKNLNDYLSFPLPFLLFILLGGMHAIRLKRKYLLWYFLFPVAHYGLIVKLGLSHTMVSLFTPVTPVFCLFLILGIMFSFTLLRERVKQPYRAGAYAGLAVLISVVIIAAYRKAAGHWYSESLLLRDTASIGRIIARNVAIPSYAVRKKPVGKASKFEQELLNHVVGFCRAPSYLRRWDLRCNGEFKTIAFEQNDWHGMIHAAYSGDRPLPPYTLSSPAATASLNPLVIIFRLQFSRPVHTLHYVDRHTTPGKGDWIRFSISPDGQDWSPGYCLSHPGRTVTWGGHFRHEIFNRSEIYLKYELYSRNVDAEKSDSAGTRLDGIYLAADFAPCRPLFADDWPVVPAGGDQAHGR